MLARRGGACASTIITQSSPMITPVFGSPSAVKAQRSRPVSVTASVFSVMPPVDATCLAIVSGFPFMLGLRLLDRAEDRVAGAVLHLDAHGVAEAHERRLQPALLYRLDGADLGD